MSAAPLAALILAGSRGEDDPVAKAAGVSHKAFAAIGDKPMLVHVIAALRATPQLGTIHVVIEAGDAMQQAAAHPDLVPLLASGALFLRAAAASPSLSVGEALQNLGTPLFIVTADHPLLRPIWVEEFLRTVPAEADIGVAMARDSAVRRDAPPSRRTYLRFSDRALSGCNMFLARTPTALAAVMTWRQVEQERKHPLRLIKLLGPWWVMRFVFGILSSEAALQRLSRLVGARIAIAEISNGLAAVDVDKADDLDLVRRLLAPPAQSSQ
jgi:GTP:adenosylcobinamide-phosphate guanylyltransferase